MVVKPTHARRVCVCDLPYFCVCLLAYYASVHVCVSLPRTAFNDLARAGTQRANEKGLWKGYNGKLTVGILPSSIFCSGHTYFVQVRLRACMSLPYTAQTRVLLRTHVLCTSALGARQLASQYTTQSHAHSHADAECHNGSLHGLTTHKCRISPVPGLHGVTTQSHANPCAHVRSVSQPDKAV